MMGAQLESVAEFAIGRILNSLPSGLLIAVFAWGLLRLLPRQNSGTRFAVWLVALLAVAGLPFIGAASYGHSFAAMGDAHALLTLPGHWGVALFLLWVVAASVAMLRLAYGLCRLRQLQRSCVEVKIDAADLNPAVRNIIAGLNSARPLRLATSERVSVPSAIGFFKPTIVIPGWALRELPPEELNIVVLHELAHLRRWDDWTNLLQKILGAVFVLHPAVWWIDSRLSLEREMACDDRVLAETANPRAYAKCLIGLLEKSASRRGWSLAQAVINRVGEASQRMAAILDVHRPATRTIWKPALGLIGIFSLACVAVAPQVVAFEERVPAAQFAETHPAAGSPPPVSAAVSIAVTLPVISSTSHRKLIDRPAERSSQPIREHQFEDQFPAPSVIDARWTPASVGNPWEFINADANQTIEPAETLLIIRTTQRIGPNSWIWSVGVWRVTFTNPAGDGGERAPVPRKT